MPIKTESQIELGDGRAVGYAEYGDLMGRPVIHLHGVPSSRFEANNPNLVAIAERLHIRLIVPIKEARVLAEAIPNARSKFFPNEGHLLIVSHFEEVFNAVVG